ncbi:MAG: hypothetical protein IT208_00450 [Chthonomonadales bacterium]|nr:hypothetical protein [Chthonomonadales bacterium]
MPRTPEQRGACIHAIEQALEARGIDYTIHGMPGAADLVLFEEYWLTNLVGAAFLLPVLQDHDETPSGELAVMVAGALREHAGQGDAPSYYVVLCGEEWTPERAASLREAALAAAPAGARLEVGSLDRFIRGDL